MAIAAESEIQTEEALRNFVSQPKSFATIAEGIMLPRLHAAFWHYAAEAQRIYKENPAVATPGLIVAVVALSLLFLPANVIEGHPESGQASPSPTIVPTASEAPAASSTVSDSGPSAPPADKPVSIRSRSPARTRPSAKSPARSESPARAVSATVQQRPRSSSRSRAASPSRSKSPSRAASPARSSRRL